MKTFIILLTLLALEVSMFSQRIIVRHDHAIIEKETGILTPVPKTKVGETRLLITDGVFNSQSLLTKTAFILSYDCLFNFAKEYEWTIMSGEEGCKIAKEDCSHTNAGILLHQPAIISKNGLKNYDLIAAYYSGQFAKPVSAKDIKIFQDSLDFKHIAAEEVPYVPEGFYAAVPSKDGVYLWNKAQLIIVKHGYLNAQKKKTPKGTGKSGSTEGKGSTYYLDEGDNYYYGGDTNTTTNNYYYGDTIIQVDKQARREARRDSLKELDPLPVFVFGMVGTSLDNQLVGGIQLGSYVPFKEFNLLGISLGYVRGNVYDKISQEQDLDGGYYGTNLLELQDAYFNEIFAALHVRVAYRLSFYAGLGKQWYSATEFSKSEIYNNLGERVQFNSTEIALTRQVLSLHAGIHFNIMRELSVGVAGTFFLEDTGWKYPVPLPSKYERTKPFDLQSVMIKVGYRFSLNNKK